MEINFDNLGPRLTKEDILNKVSEEAIYKKFCSQFPTRLIKSPFRKDRNPSFSFFKSSGKWLWKDLGTGDAGDVFRFVELDQKVDFMGALQIIASEFHITAEYKNNIVVRRNFSQTDQSKESARGRSLIQVIPRPMNEADYAWWNGRLLNRNILDAYCIRSAKEVWLDKKLIWYYKDSNPIYYWVFPFSNNIKCYRPLEKNSKFKWLSNADDTKDVQGYIQCDIKRGPKRPLILTKSMKECGFFRAFHINAMALNAEGYIANPDFIRHLKKYCYPIISLYDNDMAGYKGAMRLWNEYEIPPICVNPEWGAKDPTDLWIHDYKKCYYFLNLIYEYFESITRFGNLVNAPAELCYPAEEGKKEAGSC